MTPGEFTEGLCEAIIALGQGKAFATTVLGAVGFALTGGVALGTRSPPIAGAVGGVSLLLYVAFLLGC